MKKYLMNKIRSCGRYLAMPLAGAFLYGSAIAAPVIVDKKAEFVNNNQDISLSAIVAPEKVSKGKKARAPTSIKIYNPNTKTNLVSDQKLSLVDGSTSLYFTSALVSPSAVFSSTSMNEATLGVQAYDNPKDVEVTNENKQRYSTLESFVVKRPLPVVLKEELNPIVPTEPAAATEKPLSSTEPAAEKPAETAAKPAETGRKYSLTNFYWLGPWNAMKFAYRNSGASWAAKQASKGADYVFKNEGGFLESETKYSLSSPLEESLKSESSGVADSKATGKFGKNSNLTERLNVGYRLGRLGGADWEVLARAEYANNQRDLETEIAGYPDINGIIKEKNSKLLLGGMLGSRFNLLGREHLVRVGAGQESFSGNETLSPNKIVFVDTDYNKAGGLAVIAQYRTGPFELYGKMAKGSGSADQQATLPNINYIGPKTNVPYSWDSQLVRASVRMPFAKWADFGAQYEREWYGKIIDGQKIDMDRDGIELRYHVPRIYGVSPMIYAGKNTAKGTSTMVAGTNEKASDFYAGVGANINLTWVKTKPTKQKIPAPEKN